MRIGIDIDDTITRIPDFFAFLSRVLLEAKHEVHIITYRSPDSRKRTEKQLLEFGISYTKLHIWPGTMDGHEWKGKIATELMLDIMFENDPRNLVHMPDRIQKFLLCNPQEVDLGRLLD